VAQPASASAFDDEQIDVLAALAFVRPAAPVVSLSGYRHPTGSAPAIGAALEPPSHTDAHGPAPLVKVSTFGRDAARPGASVAIGSGTICDELPAVVRPAARAARLDYGGRRDAMAPDWVARKAAPPLEPSTELTKPRADQAHSIA
jgi:hypothetical protein